MAAEIFFGMHPDVFPVSDEPSGRHCEIFPDEPSGRHCVIFSGMVL